MLEFKGKVEKIFSENQVSDKFRKREFVVLGGNDGKQYVTFQVVQAKCDLVKELSVGDQITVQFLAKGRKWKPDNGEARYYTTLEAIHILSSNKTKNVDFFDEAERKAGEDDWLNTLE